MSDSEMKQYTKVEWDNEVNIPARRLTVKHPEQRRVIKKLAQLLKGSGKLSPAQREGLKYFSVPLGRE